MTRTLGQSDTLQTAAGSANLRGITVSHFSGIRAKLDQGLENVTISVIGDSTGVGNGLAFTQKRWPYRFGEMLAAAYPAYTVRWKPWNIATPGYDSWATVQTGTGTGNAGAPFNIDIYNGSASGKDPAYSQGNLLGSNGLMPYGIMPDLIFINHSHNMGTTVDANSVNYALYSLVRDALRWYNPNAAVVVFGQNPSALIAGSGMTPSPVQHQQRQTRIAELCGTEGWGFININRTFLQDPNWLTNLINPDGVHPNDAGSILWAKTIWDIFSTAGPWTLPHAARPVADAILIPASAMTPTLLIGGSPAPAVLNNFLPTMSFSKQAGVVGATFDVYIPPSWKQVNVWVDWVTSDGVAGTVAWQVDNAYQNRLGSETVNGTGTSALSMNTGSAPTVSAAPTVALAEAHTRIGGAPTSLGITTTSPQQPRRVFMRVGRSGANAGDTYAGDRVRYPGPHRTRRIRLVT